MPILNADYSNLDHIEMAMEIGLKAKHMPMLISSFIEESASVMEKLRNSIELKDFDNIRAYAHSLKGSTGNLKLNELYEMAKEIEISAMESKSDFDYDGYYQAMYSAILTIK